MVANPPQLYDQDVDRRGAKGPTPGLTGGRRPASPETVIRDEAIGGGRAPRAPRPQGSSRRRVAPAPPRRGFWRSAAGWLIPLAVLVGSAAGIVWLLQTEEDADTVAAPDGEVAGQSIVAPGPVALLLQLGDSGEAVAFTVVALNGADGGHVILIPSGTMVEIPGFGLDSLAVAYDAGGAELAALALRNLLTIDFEHVAVMGAGELGAMARSLGPLDVDNPQALDRVDESGRIEQVWPAGPVQLEQGDIGRFLGARAVGESDLNRLVRHQAFWKAFLAARALVAATTGEPERDWPAFLDETAVRSDALLYRILPVESIGGDQGLYAVQDDALDELLAAVVPSSTASGGERARVQILNGVGTPGLAEPVTALLLGANVSVELTGNAREFGHEETQIVYYRDDQIEAALRIQDQLGLGVVVKQRETIDVVDVTVVVGADLASMVAGRSPGAAE